MHDNANDGGCLNVCRAERIARLNDKLRKRGEGGQILITRGVDALIAGAPTELLRTLANYSDFDPTNDPHGERDFGAFDFAGAELLWKVDYYQDADLEWGSDDPADASASFRVLTIMLAEEH